MLKISYLSGAADFKSTYDAFVGTGAPTFFGTNYPAQFIQLTLEHDAQAQVITWQDTAASREKYGERFEVLNRPMPWSSGLRYHVETVAWNMRQLCSMLRFRPDVLVVTGNQDFWWVYAPLRLIGTKIIPSFHCVQWPIFRKPSRRKRFYAALNTLLVLRSSPAIVVTSQAIRRQVESLIGDKIPILEHLPTYSRSQFEELALVRPATSEPFSVLFVGRVEENKGVFDLLEIAAALKSTHPGRFHFHVCGTGNALGVLKERTRSKGLADSVTIYGYCEPAKLSAIIKRSHCYIVPTRSDFEAGYEMTCAEAILAHRPLITSAVAPAIDDVRDASIEVPPDDQEAYLRAIQQLANDRSLYASKVEACRPIAERFYDYGNSWKVKMSKAISLLGL